MATILHFENDPPVVSLWLQQVGSTNLKQSEFEEFEEGPSKEVDALYIGHLVSTGIDEIPTAWFYVSVDNGDLYAWCVNGAHTLCKQVFSLYKIPYTYHILPRVARQPESFSIPADGIILKAQIPCETNFSPEGVMRAAHAMVAV